MVHSHPPALGGHPPTPHSQFCVFVLGAGRAGRGLARALRASGVTIAGTHGRRVASGDDPVSAGAIPSSIGDATCVLVTVRDAQLDAAIRELSSAPLAQGAVVLHASGSVEPPALAMLRTRGHPAGTFHPLVALADPAQAAATLRGAWIGIDGDAGAQETAQRLAEALGAHTLRIPTGEKARYHAAAVFASNFPTVLLCLAEALLREAGVPTLDARHALHPLFKSAVDNLRGKSGAEALTGPIVRGDVATVRRHVQALTGNESALRAYRALSRVAVSLAREAGTDESALAEIESLLG